MRARWAPTTIGATINGAAVTTSLPAVSVVPGAASPAASLLFTAADSLGVGDATTLELQVFDAFGNPVTDAGLSVIFSVTPPAVGAVGAAGHLPPHRYTTTFTAQSVGTAQVGATIHGVAVTTASPTVRVE